MILWGFWNEAGLPKNRGLCRAFRPSQRALAGGDHRGAQAEQLAPPGSKGRQQGFILLHDLRTAQRGDRPLRPHLAARRPAGCGSVVLHGLIQPQIPVVMGRFMLWHHGIMARWSNSAIPSGNAQDTKFFPDTFSLGAGIILVTPMSPIQDRTDMRKKYWFSVIVLFLVLTGCTSTTASLVSLPTATPTSTLTLPPTPTLTATLTLTPTPTKTQKLIEVKPTPTPDKHQSGAELNQPELPKWAKELFYLEIPKWGIDFTTLSKAERAKVKIDSNTRYFAGIILPILLTVFKKQEDIFKHGELNNLRIV